MTLMQLLRAHNAALDPECHEAADRIERLEGLLREARQFVHVENVPYETPDTEGLARRIDAELETK